MAIIVNDNLDPRTPKLTDRRNGPFATVSEALAAININVRKDGLPVIIGFGDDQKEYWFKNGELVVKTGGAATAAEGTFEFIEVDSNGNLII